MVRTQSCTWHPQHGIGGHNFTIENSPAVPAQLLSLGIGKKYCHVCKCIWLWAPCLNSNSCKLSCLMLVIHCYDTADSPMCFADHLPCLHQAEPLGSLSTLNFCISVWLWQYTMMHPISVLSHHSLNLWETLQLTSYYRKACAFEAQTVLLCLSEPKISGFCYDYWMPSFP